MIDGEETLTAYHEAGHAVIGYALGGTVERVRLGGEADDNLPERFGECLINWGDVDPRINWQKQRELMTILAGPVSEMIYRGETFHPATFGAWEMDWRQAWMLCEASVPNEDHRTQLLEELLQELFLIMSTDACWAAIAAVADELLAHEFLEREQLCEALEFWIRRS